MKGQSKGERERGTGFTCPSAYWVGAFQGAGAGCMGAVPYLRAVWVDPYILLDPQVVLVVGTSLGSWAGPCLPAGRDVAAASVWTSVTSLGAAVRGVAVFVHPFASSAYFHPRRACWGGFPETTKGQGRTLSCCTAIVRTLKTLKGCYPIAAGPAHLIRY